MLLSSFKAGFYAIAADAGETSDSAVTDVETKIAAFYDNRTYLFSTSNAERHEQAVKDYDCLLYTSLTITLFYSNIYMTLIIPRQKTRAVYIKE